MERLEIPDNITPKLATQHLDHVRHCVRRSWSDYETEGAETDFEADDEQKVVNAIAFLQRIPEAIELLEKIVSYQREDPDKASAHCMRRSCEDALIILSGVEQ